MNQQKKLSHNPPLDTSPMPTDLAKAPQVASSRPKVKNQPQYPKEG